MSVYLYLTIVEKKNVKMQPKITGCRNMNYFVEITNANGYGK